ncbi:hypothetical protein ONZ43_g5304 [Nemania bipapillata]|uniref:Uncharacterized protein n=1 Tax=Nemania bipapillata TaxID=110536 RepID=A0ACC2ICE6_9PEZI|nr:hypothetical protein ONZ43_g5304 [Nemania bipapillata]
MQKLATLTGFTDTRLIKAYWGTIKKKLAENSAFVTATIGANWENPQHDNMGDNQEVLNGSSSSLKRKACELTPSAAHASAGISNSSTITNVKFMSPMALEGKNSYDVEINAETPTKKAKKTRVTKTPSSKKKAAEQKFAEDMRGLEEYGSNPGPATYRSQEQVVGPYPPLDGASGDVSVFQEPHRQFSHGVQEYPIYTQTYDNNNNNNNVETYFQGSFYPAQHGFDGSAQGVLDEGPAPIAYGPEEQSSPPNTWSQEMDDYIQYDDDEDAPLIPYLG